MQETVVGDSFSVISFLELFRLYGKLIATYTSGNLYVQVYGGGGGKQKKG